MSTKFAYHKARVVYDAERCEYIVEAKRSVLSRWEFDSSYMADCYCTDERANQLATIKAARLTQKEVIVEFANQNPSLLLSIATHPMFVASLFFFFGYMTGARV